MTKIVSFAGHFHMYKEVEGQHWVGMVDHRIGCLTTQVTADVAATFVECENHCYNPEEVDSFENATIEQLKHFENV